MHLCEQWTKTWCVCYCIDWNVSLPKKWSYNRIIYCLRNNSRLHWSRVIRMYVLIESKNKHCLLLIDALKIFYGNDVKSYVNHSVNKILSIQCNLYKQMHSNVHFVSFHSFIHSRCLCINRYLQCICMHGRLAIIIWHIKNGKCWLQFQR